MLGNGFDRLRSDVAGQHDSWYFPSKSCTQGLNTLDTIHWTWKVEIGQYEVGAHAFLGNQCQSLVSVGSRNHGQPFRSQQRFEPRTHKAVVFDDKDRAAERLTGFGRGHHLELIPRAYALRHHLDR